MSILHRSLGTLATNALTNLSEDLTPTLGGNLDGGGKIQYNTILNQQSLGQVSTNQTLDCASYNQFSFEPTAAITINFINMKVGCVVSVRITGGGDHTLTWQVGGATTNFKWAEGEEPEWAIDSGMDIATFIGDGVDSLSGGLSFGAVAVA